MEHNFFFLIEPSKSKGSDLCSVYQNVIQLCVVKLPQLHYTTHTGNIAMPDEGCFNINSLDSM